MNKLTKVGLSALCGSLAAVSSANAGEMTVTGGVDMTWASYDDASTGNPIGMGSNLTFKGAGELDNGWTFGVTVAMLNQDAYSTTAVNIVMGGLGALNLNQGDSGNGIDALDDKMPTAWEEAWGAGLGTGIQLVQGVGANSNVQYTTPKVGGITVALAVAPDMGSADVNDKGSAGSADNTGSGYDATVNINPSFGTEILSGLDIFVGGHVGERYVDGTPGNDRYEAIGGLTYSLGPIAIGYARSGIDTGANTTVTDPAWYKNSMFGISFNVNDDLSVSYAEHESEQGLVNDGTRSTDDVEVSSFQVAYTMGGASVRYASISSDNSSYQDSNDFDKEAQIISVSLAF